MNYHLINYFVKVHKFLSTSTISFVDIISKYSLKTFLQGLVIKKANIVQPISFFSITSTTLPIIFSPFSRPISMIYPIITEFEKSKPFVFN
jgi:hypothetical protein